MYRSRLTLEVFVKAVACFCFGFLLGYLTFTLIAHPNDNTVFAETSESESESTPEPELYPKTYSDLPDAPLAPESTLLHQPKPSYVHLYDYARYRTYYYSPVQASEPEPEAESTPSADPSIDSSTPIQDA